jgi:hypothetical protein
MGERARNRWITNNERKPGTLQVSRWSFKLPIRNGVRVFVVVTRQDNAWANVADELEPYSLVSILADRENANVNLYAQVQAQLALRAQTRARARV